MPSKDCSIDRMPTNVVKGCRDVLASISAEIVNTSIRTGVFPDDLKLAVIRPFIMKLGLDINNLKNYRSVSNCSFLDKLLKESHFTASSVPA